MLQRISGRLTDYLVDKNIIRYDDREIYNYGLLAMFSTVINFLVILIIGIILGLVHETLIYLFAFALLRCYCGGYHAKTQMGCILGTVALYSVSMAVYYFLPKEYDRMFSMISAGACLIFIFALAPIEHKNRTFEGSEYRQFRLVARIIAVLYVLITYVICIFIYQLIMVASVLALVMLNVSFVLALGLIYNERSET